MVRINNTQYFHFLQQADALRRSGSLCDAIISVKSQTFRAHRLVLACASRRLAQQLAQADTDSPAHCTLEYFSPRTFQQVLDFTYTQAVEVSVDDLYLLLRAAQLLEMWSLEDQCRKHLETLDPRVGREEEEGGETKDVKEERGSAEDLDEMRKGSPVQEGKRQQTPSTGEKTSKSTVTENDSPPEGHSSSPSSRKRPRLSSLSPAPHNSVISWPATSSSSSSSSSSSPTSSSSSSSSSPWTFSSNMWSSVSTLRRIAENYSNFFGAQCPSQSSVAYPFSLSAPHMFPLLSPHFQNRVNHSGLYPHCAQNLYPGSTGMSSMIKQGLLKTKKSSHRAFKGAVPSIEQSFPHVPKARAERVKDFRWSTAGRLGDPAPQESASSASGAGCQFRGKDVRCEQPSSHPARQSTGGDKPYQCKHCPKRFSLKHQLDTHHRVHTGEKPFECLRCGQRSRDYSAMIKHLRTHGGAAPYQCTVCLEFCSSLVAMHRHVKSHAVQDFPPDWNINSTYLYTSHI